MHEHVEILSKYMLICHLGPTQTQKKNTMGHRLIKKIKKICKKINFFPTLSKNNPTLEILESKT